MNFKKKLTQKKNSTTKQDQQNTTDKSTLRANIKEIILCHENKSDIDEIKSDYLVGLTFHYVKEMSEVIAIALTTEKVKNAKILEDHVIYLIFV